MKKETLHQEISISSLDIYKVKFPYTCREEKKQIDTMKTNQTKIYYVVIALIILFSCFPLALLHSFFYTDIKLGSL